MSERTVTRIIRAQPTQDGAGVSLFRSLGSQQLPDWNPFLLLDEIRSDQANEYIAGFPEHPHRGFETVTIMLEGKMRHRDNQGNEGVIESGGVQWMTAGRGIVHSEMPEQESGELWGFQLWVNLPAEYKMIKPRYQDIPAKDIPVIDTRSSRIRLMAGKHDDEHGPVQSIVTNPTLMDVHLDGELRLQLPQRAFIYVYDGAINCGKTTIQTQHLALLSSTGELALTGKGRALVVATDPLHEPVARYGPFVMNTREQLMQAFEDYQAGRF